MKTRLEKEVRFLKIYAAVATLFCATFLAAFAAQNRKPRFEEIDVERINIVEKDGRLRMVISNQERQHPGIANGKIIKRDHPKEGRESGCRSLRVERRSSNSWTRRAGSFPACPVLPERQSRSPVLFPSRRELIWPDGAC